MFTCQVKLAKNCWSKCLKRKLLALEFLMYFKYFHILSLSRCSKKMICFKTKLAKDVRKTFIVYSALSR